MLTTPNGGRPTKFKQAFAGLVYQNPERRIAAFEPAGAKEAAILVAERRPKWRPIDLRDTQPVLRWRGGPHRNTKMRDTGDQFIPVIDPWMA